MTESNYHSPDSKAFSTVTELAERWQCSEKKVRREISAGRLIAHRFGRQLRISAHDREIYERLRREA